MVNWSLLLAASLVGFGAGTATTFFFLKARLKFYRKFIEDRLSTLNPPSALVDTGHIR